MSRLLLRKILHAALLGTLVIFSLSIPRGVASDVLGMPGADDPKPVLAKCWEYIAVPDLSQTAKADSANIYFVDVERRLEAVDLIAGAKLWSTDLAGTVVSNLLLTAEAIVLATNVVDSSGAIVPKTLLRSVSKQTGITNWTAELPARAELSLGSANGQILAIASSGTITSFEASGGRLVWKREIGASVTAAPHFGAQSFILGTDRKEILMIAVATEQVSILTRTDGVPTATLSDASGRVLIGDDRGNLILATAEGKRIWRFRNGARISALAAYDSEYLATSHDNFVYKISRGGDVEWKRRLSARISSAPHIVGDSGILATVGDGAVYIVDLGNGKIRNRLEIGDDTSAQVTGNGNGVVIVGPRMLSLYTNNQCPANKKTVPVTAPFLEG